MGPNLPFGERVHFLRHPFRPKGKESIPQKSSFLKTYYVIKVFRYVTDVASARARWKR
jgi:hypothetical protein